MTTSRSEYDYRERTPSGEHTWPNNAEVSEHLRCGLLVQADKAEAAGDQAKAEDLRERAAFQRRERDRLYREHERRMLNRSMAVRCYCGRIGE